MAAKRLFWLALALGALAGGTYYALGRYGHVFPALRRVQEKVKAAPARPDEDATRWDAEAEEKRIEYNRDLIDGLRDALEVPGGAEGN